jgi:hypothetical protein
MAEYRTFESSKRAISAAPLAFQSVSLRPPPPHTLRKGRLLVCGRYLFVQFTLCDILYVNWSKHAVEIGRHYSPNIQNTFTRAEIRFI